MKILITGSRNWPNERCVNDAILDASGWQEFWGPDPRDITIVHGSARGADTIASRVARKFGMNEESYPANWAEFGRAAGPIRNQQMVDAGADICLAFLMPGSVGTTDCIRRAEKAGIEVVRYYED